MTQKIIIENGEESIEIQPDNLSNELRNKAIETTINLLDTENIAHIIYIDDKFDIDGQKEVFKARLNELKITGNYITTDTFNNIDWTAPQPKFESSILDLWRKTDDKSALLFDVCTHIEDEENSNIIPALEIKNYYGDRIKLMTPDEWIKNKYEVIEELEENQKALCLFDFEFQSGNELARGRNGVQLAKSLIDEKNYMKKIVCGIFSHKFTEEQEDEFRERYSEDYNIEIEKFYTISKRRFAFDPQISGFAEGIKNLLLLPYVEKLKKESLNVLTESNRKAGDRIKKMTPKTFNQIIQKSSLKEGVWEISTLFRLYGLLSKEENYNMIAEPTLRQNFNESIKKIREIDLKDTGYNSKLHNQQLIDLRNSELYLSGNIINKLHLPLTNGDIFTIKDKEYILLVQPCNLALRTNGKRDYGYNTGMLIPLKYVEKNKLSITSEEIKIAENSDQYYVAYFPEHKIISLDFLDLSIFNNDGKASIDFKILNLTNELIHFPWLKRYEYIYKSLLAFEKKISEFKTVKNIANEKILEKRELAKEAVEPQKSKLKEEIRLLKEHLDNTEKSIFDIEDLRKVKIDCTKIYNSQSRILDTTIKRLKHYKSPYSDNLLQKFMQYLSRNAFDHDFTSS